MDWLGLDSHVRWTGYSSQAEPKPTMSTIKSKVDENRNIYKVLQVGFTPLNICCATASEIHRLQQKLTRANFFSHKNEQLMYTLHSSKSLQKIALCLRVNEKEPSQKKHTKMSWMRQKKMKRKIRKLFLPADMLALLMQE